MATVAVKHTDLFIEVFGELVALDAAEQFEKAKGEEVKAALEKANKAVEKAKADVVSADNGVTLAKKTKNKQTIEEAKKTLKNAKTALDNANKALTAAKKAENAFEKAKTDNSKNVRGAFESNKKVRAAVDAVIQKGPTEADTGYRFQALLSELQKLGVDVPPKVSAFVEGLIRLQNCHNELADFLNDTKNLYGEYVAQVRKGNPKLAPREKDDIIGQLLDLLVAKPDAFKNINEDPYVSMRSKIADLAWDEKGKVTGTLADKIRMADKGEGIDGKKEDVAHLVSLVSRHAFPEDVTEIDTALAHYTDVKRRLQDVEKAGMTDRKEKLSKEKDAALDKLLHAIANGVTNIFSDLNLVRFSEPPKKDDFETETAADVFSQIVNGNLEATKKALSVTDAGRLVYAGRKATSNDKYHQHDGHKKVSTSKL